MDNPSIMSHVSIGVTDIDRSGAFYDAVLATIGARRIMEHEGLVAYGRAFPEFWIGRPFDGGPANPGNGSHFGFLAASREEVDAFWAAGLAQGGTADGAPGPREEYGPSYYGCFLRDPDGHKIEAQFSDDDADEVAEVEAHPT